MIRHFCDICDKRMDFPRFIRFEPRRLNVWGVSYDVCEDCFEDIGNYIIAKRREVKPNDKRRINSNS